MSVPRIRYIKPGFFTNDELAEIRPVGRLLFIGLWCLADKAGRLEDRPRRIKASILPFDGVSADRLLNELAEHGFITRYEVEGQPYIQVINFLKHQRPHHKEEPSTLPSMGQGRVKVGPSTNHGSRTGQGWPKHEPCLPCS